MARPNPMLMRSCAILAVTVHAAAPAVAQEDPEPILLDPIIVQGELQGRDLQRTPTSVVVATGEELEQRGDIDIYDLANRTPNVVVSNGRQGFGIRGIDQRGVGGGGQGQLVSVQVDGIALPGNQATFFGPYSTWDLEQVEILRGPQSTQQGRNALAGAIIVRSADPTYEFETKLRGEIGSRDTRAAAVAVNVPLVDGRAAFRFAAESFRTDGWVENPTRNEDDYDARELDTYRAKLRLDPVDTLSMIFSYSRTKNSAGEDFVEEAFFPDERLNFSNEASEEGSDQEIFGLRVNWEIDPRFTLESETTYFSNDYTRREDFDGTAADLGLFDRDGTAEAFEQDLRLTFDLGNVTGVAGLFYGQSDNEIPTIFEGDAAALNPAIPPGFATFVRDFNFGNESENFAIFGEADIDASELLPGLTFTVGARYDWESVTDIQSETVTTTPPAEFLPPELQALIPAETDLRNDADFEAFLPKLAIGYDWTPDIFTSFTIQRGYRSGGVSSNTFTGEVQEFDPEFTWNYELALRSQFYDDRLTVNANVFYTDWEDQQVAVAGPSGNILDVDVVNAGESRLWGGELLVEARPTPEIDVFASLGYVNTEFTDFDTAQGDFTGNEFPNAPEFTGAFGGSYRFDNGIVLAADAAYTDDAFVEAANDPDQKSDDRLLVNASVSYRQTNWEATLFARNLFDVDYKVQDVGTNIRAGEPFTGGAFVRYFF